MIINHNTVRRIHAIVHETYPYVLLKDVEQASFGPVNQFDEPLLTRFESFLGYNLDRDCIRRVLISNKIFVYLYGPQFEEPDLILVG